MLFSSSAQQQAAAHSQRHSQRLALTLTPPLLAPLQPLEFVGCTLSSGVMTMALAWVLFDFVDDPPDSGNFSSPK